MTTRPYPNVRSRSGSRWEAYHPTNGGQSVYLGVFDSPEAAHRAVLEARTAHFEQKARNLRAEAEEFA